MGFELTAAPVTLALVIRRAIRARVLKTLTESSYPNLITKKARNALASKMTPKHVRSVFVRVRAFHGKQPLSPRPVTPSQLPFLDTPDTINEHANQPDSLSVNTPGFGHTSAFSAPNVGGNSRASTRATALHRLLQGCSCCTSPKSRMKIRGAKGIDAGGRYRFSSEAAIPKPVQSVSSIESSTQERGAEGLSHPPGPPTVQAQWYNWVDLSIPIQDLPRASKLVFELVTTVDPGDYRGGDADYDGGVDEHHKRKTAQVTWLLTHYPPPLNLRNTIIQKSVSLGDSAALVFAGSGTESRIYGASPFSRRYI